MIISLFIIFLPGGCQSSQNDGSTLDTILNNINGEPVVPREANRLFISGFSNSTHVSLVSDKLIIKLKSQINIDGRLAVVSATDNADLRLDGSVLTYQLQPVAFGNIGEPVRKRLRITASVKLFDLKKNKEIFSEQGIQAFEEFSETIPPISSEVRTQDKVLDILSDRITLKVINGWYTKLMTPIEKGKK